MYYMLTPAGAKASSTPVLNKLPDVTRIPTDEEVNAFLTKNEKSYGVNMAALSRLDSQETHSKWTFWAKTPTAKHEPSTGNPNLPPVVEYHVNQIASNNPIEDYHSEDRYKNGVIFGIFDGHSGTACAQILSEYLGPYVAQEISKLPPLSDQNSSTRKAQVSNALKQAFAKVDDDIINAGISVNGKGTSSDELMARVRAAAAGACAIVAYLEGSNIYVACTGDCRAVIGRSRGDGTFEAIPLSEDQTIRNPAEYARILAEHPGEEETVFVRGRILGGLMPTRAFGDARYKWKADDQEALQIRRPRNNYLTPPYVTAVPEVTCYTLDRKSDMFLIMATDGIWDCLNNEQSVDLIAGHMSNHGKIPGKVIPTSLEGTWSWADKNPATHLIRNALAEGDVSRVNHLLAIPAPRSRRYRDDMTATIVYFAPEGASSKEASEIGADSAGLEKPFRNMDLNKAGMKQHMFQPFVRSLQQAGVTPTAAKAASPSHKL
ncbi:phosphatase 2C-like domain-containing protein [Phlyctochytrium arcticum]|nr:phosphatase 2C-like domain-containing protein [Phlyctochytrium arcticum]